MVLEDLVNPFVAEKKPWELFIFGFVYTAVGVFAALWIFKEQASMVMVFFTVIAALPLFYHTMRLEEKKDLVLLRERDILKEHAKALRFLTAFFLGSVLAFTFAYVLLPSDRVDGVFRAQEETISSVNQKVTGNTYSLTVLSKIFLNNIKVMVFSLLFSFLYGTGALFIMVWNASVIGAAAGNFFRTHLAEYASSVGLAKVGSYFSVISLTILRYSIHGIPEILGYWIAGLAGGILSVSVIRKDYRLHEFERVLLDVSDLIVLAAMVLFVAAVLEVYVTPLIVS
ncbi:stage II sporulation protein M [Candidatus Woesearchaeota archaeon]|nr:stage II sporulation protein M [Candidatus Woesearchaeota archaeon]